MNLGAKMAVEEQVFLHMISQRLLYKNQGCSHTKLFGVNDGSQAVVSAYPSVCDDPLISFFQCISQHEFQFAHLVAAVNAGRLVIMLDPDIGEANCLAQRLKFLDRRRPVSQRNPGQAFFQGWISFK